MLAPSVVVDDCGASSCYLQDDIVRALRTSLVSVLSATLADNRANSGYLKGVFDLARSQAALYGIPWCDLVASLQDVPELWNLVLSLRGESCVI